MRETMVLILNEGSLSNLGLERDGVRFEIAHEGGLDDIGEVHGEVDDILRLESLRFMHAR
jgi:hypothetical protein